MPLRSSPGEMYQRHGEAGARQIEDTPEIEEVIPCRIGGDEAAIHMSQRSIQERRAGAPEMVRESRKTLPPAAGCFSADWFVPRKAETDSGCDTDPAHAALPLPIAPRIAGSLGRARCAPPESGWRESATRIPHRAAWRWIRPAPDPRAPIRGAGKTTGDYCDSLSGLQTVACSCRGWSPDMAWASTWERHSTECGTGPPRTGPETR